MKGSKTILGFIAGVSIGAIAGILLSPEKGSDTRQKIADRTSEFGNSLKDCFTDLIKGKKKTTDGHNDGGNISGMNLNTMG